MLVALSLVFVDLLTALVWPGVQESGAGLLLRKASASPSPGCVFQLDEGSPKYPPHLIDLSKLEVIQPELVGKKRVLSLSAGQEVSVTCQGAKNALSATNAPVNTATCKAPSSLQIGEQNLSYASLGCKSQTKEAFKELGACSKTGTKIDIGWEVDELFLNQLTVCHDREASHTLWSSSVIRGASILADDESNTRPAFRKGSYYPGIDVDKAYTQSVQKSVLARILGSAAQADRFFDVSKGFYFARGHLAPDGDFVDAASQDATYYYVNCAPQWQSFNNGNWKALETAVRELAAGRRASYTIYTGTHGVLTLPDTKGKQKPIYLAKDANNNDVLPAPKFYWKIVHDPVAGKATAVVGINNPWADPKEDHHIICPDVCAKVPWITFQRTKLTSGYTYCCTVAKLREALGTSMPDQLDGDLPLLD